MALNDVEAQSTSAWGLCCPMRLPLRAGASHLSALPRCSPLTHAAHHCRCRICAPQNKIASKGRGILAMDESNATCGKRLESIGLEVRPPAAMPIQRDKHSRLSFSLLIMLISTWADCVDAPLTLMHLGCCSGQGAPPLATPSLSAKMGAEERPDVLWECFCACFCVFNPKTPPFILVICA